PVCLCLAGPAPGLPGQVITAQPYFKASRAPFICTGDAGGTSMNVQTAKGCGDAVRGDAARGDAARGGAARGGAARGGAAGGGGAGGGAARGGAARGGAARGGAARGGAARGGAARGTAGRGTVARSGRWWRAWRARFGLAEVCGTVAA